MRRGRLRMCFSGLTLLLMSGAIHTSFAAELLPPDRPIAEAIDHYINRDLQNAKISPAPLVDDANLIRRTTLDLAGRIPLAREVEVFTASDDQQKRQKLVQRLLNSPDYAWHLRNELDAMLLAQKKNDGNFRSYLAWATEQNRPWDQMFKDMLIGSEQDENIKNAMEFTRSRANSLDDLTNDTSSVFFGVSINCAKCHDHPLVSDWKQDHYFGMASFFNRTYLTKKNTLAEKYSGRVKFKTTEGKEKLAEYMFLTGFVVNEPEQNKTKEQLKQEDEEVKKQQKDKNAPPPKPPTFSPRSKLVEVALSAENRQFFARAIVNRTWKRFFGHAIIESVDQMHSENPASHPELLEWLTRDFIAHNYDMKRLIEGIVLSDAYARSSLWDQPGEPPVEAYFAFVRPRVLTPWQYSLSLLIASSSPSRFPTDQKPEDWKKLRGDLEKHAESYSRNFEQITNNFQVSVDEALLLSNNDRFQNDLFREAGDRIVGHLKTIEDDKTLIETAFWNVLSRAPEAQEMAAFQDYLKKRPDRKPAAIQQMVWALITSPELRFNY